jgi:hypothetical protein
MFDRPPFKPPRGRNIFEIQSSLFGVVRYRIQLTLYSHLFCSSPFNPLVRYQPHQNFRNIFNIITVRFSPTAKEDPNFEKKHATKVRCTVIFIKQICSVYSLTSESANRLSISLSWRPFSAKIQTIWNYLFFGDNS